jgi:hypothetical protein
VTESGTEAETTWGRIAQRSASDRNRHYTGDDARVMNSYPVRYLCEEVDRLRKRIQVLEAANVGEG